MENKARGEKARQYARLCRHEAREMSARAYRALREMAFLLLVLLLAEKACAKMASSSLSSCESGIISCTVIAIFSTLNRQ